MSAFSRHTLAIFLGAMPLDPKGASPLKPPNLKFPRNFRILKLAQSFKLRGSDSKNQAPRLRGEFSEFSRKASRGAVSATAASEIFGWNFKPVAQKTARKVSLERAGLPKRKFAKSVRRLSQPIKTQKITKRTNH